MNRRAFAAATLVSMLLFFMTTGLQSLNMAVANWQPPALQVITISGDGNVTPSGVPISPNGSVYTLTDNISGYEVHVECANIVLDGAGYTLAGDEWRSAIGITLEGAASGVSVKDFKIEQFDTCIYVSSYNNLIAKNNMTACVQSIDVRRSSYNSIIGNIFAYSDVSVEISFDSSFIYVVGNTFTNNPHALDVYSSGNNTISRNNFMNNSIALNIFSSSNNTIFHNNFINNTENIRVITGDLTSQNFTSNYWSNYNGTDANSDGIGDTPYVVYESVNDLYPLMEPFDTASVTDELLFTTPTPSASASTLSPSTEPSASPFASEQPATSSPQPQPTTFPAEITYTAAGAAAIAVIVAAAVMLRKRK